MISVTEAAHRIAQNTAEYKRQKAVKSFDLMKFHGADAVAGEMSEFTLVAKAFDLLASIHIGGLAFLRKKNGADGVLIKKGVLVEVEFKTSARTISRDNAFRTYRGTIYVTKPEHMTEDMVNRNKTASLKSSFVASFDQTDATEASKNRDTYLIAFDETNNTVIDCYMLTGNVVIDKLESSKSIKLSSFMNEGIQVELASGPVIGFTQWENNLLKTLRCKETFLP